MNKKLSIVILFVLVLMSKHTLFSQGNTCQQATPFCTSVGTPFVYPNVHNGSVAQTGPNYGCLTNKPDPSWFYIKTSAAGVMTFSLSQTVNANGTGGGLDVDFIAYGPFNSATGNCGSLTAGNTVGCSYSPASTETLSINSPAAGKYYIIMITNYTGQTSPPGTPGYIAITQTGGPGTDCSIACPLDNFTLVGSVNATGVNIPNGSTVNCIDPFVIQPPRLPLNNVNSDILTPCIKVSYQPFTSNISSNGTVLAYEAGSVAWAANCPTCAATVGGTVAVPGNGFSTYYTQSDPAQQHDFSFCNGAGAIGTTTVTLENCWTGALIAGPTIWSGSAASCFTLTSPANTSIGTGTFSIAPATGSVGIVDLNWGLLYVDPSFLPGGQTYTVTYTFKGPPDCPPVHGTYTFSVPAVQSVNAITSQTVCSGSTVAATNFTTSPAGGAYTWNNNNINVGVGGSGSTNIGSYTAPTVLAPTVGSFTVTPTLSGCIGTSKTFSITINPKPTPSITSTPASTLCLGSSLTFTGSGASTYTWSGSAGNGLSGSTGTNITATPTATGNITYTTNVMSVAGCTNTVSKTITVNPIPTANAGSSNSITCTTPTIGLSGSGGGTYSWTGPGITSGATSSTPSVNVAGTYSLVVTSAAGCTSTISTVTVPQNTTAPTAGASNTTTLTCTTTSAILTGTGGGSYNWTGPGTITNGTSANPTVSSAGTFTVKVTAANGCTNTAVTTIIQNTTAPTAGANNTTTLTCTTTSAILTGTGGGSYNWTGPGTITNGTSANPTVNSAGTFTVKVTAANGCTNTAVTTVSQNTTAPTAGASNTTTLTCTTTSAALTGTGGGSYNWTGPGTITNGTSANPTVNSAGSFTVKVTAANGCTNTAVTSVTQNTTAPAPTATTINSLNCTSTTAILNGGPATGVTYQWSGTGLSGGTTSQTATATGAGSYTLLVTATNGCTNTAVTSVTQNTTTPVTVASSTGSITCVTSTVNLSSSVAGLSYTWTAPSGSSITGSSNLQNATGQGLGTYTLNVLNPANGCTYTTSIAAVQNTTTPTSVNAGANQVLICGVPTVTLTGSASPASATANWLGGVVSPTNFTTTTGSANTYTLQAINPTTGCFITSTVQVTSSVGAPTASIIPVTNSITCTNSLVTIGINPTSAGPFTYQWPSAGISGATNNATATATLPGVYSVTLTNSPGNNCSIQLSITVPINTTAVTPSITPASTITCNTTSLTLNVSPVGAYTYTWTGSSPIVSGANTQNPDINNGGTYSVSITNTVNGCVGNANVTVSSNTTAPSFTLGTASSVTTTCSSPNATLSATSNNDPNTVYTWTTPSSTSLTGSVVVVSNPGTYSVVITNTINGCSTSATAPATVDVVADAGIPNITLSSNSLSITCSNPTPSVTITTTASPVSYSWAPTVGILAGTATSATPIFTAAGSYSTVVTNTISGCATGISGNIVDVVLNNSTPVISLSSATNNGTLTCVDLSVTVSPTITPTSSDLTYTWSPSAGISSPVNQANATFTATGIYTLAITNTLTGCVSTSTSSASSYTVTSDNAVPTATVNAISSNSIIGCGTSNASVTLGSSVTAGNSTSTVWLPGSISSPTIDVTSAGDYTLVVTDAVNGCSVTSVYTVGGSTLAPQGVDAGSFANIACGDATVTLNGTSTSTNVSYSWAGPSATSLTGTNTANPVASEVGDYTLTVTDNATGCQSSANVTVTQAIATASITANPTNGLSPLDVAFNATGAGSPTFVWDFANGNTSTSQNPNNTFLTGTYIVTLTATSGSCIATATVTIVVEDGLTLEIPNVFTPNNDGKNDIFTINSTGVKELSLQIFNRWGQKLYEFSGSKASWDGKVPNGSSAPEGTYFYFVKATGFDDKVIEKNGAVTLFR